MTEGNLPFLNEEGFDEPEQIEAPAEAAPEPEEPKGEPEAAPPAASEDSAKHIPISALLDEREKRQAATRELEELRRQLAAQQQQTTQQPDFYENPEARLQAERQQVQHMLWNERLNTSELVARNAFGDDVVNEAQQAFLAEARNNPALHMELQRQANPYGYVVQWHKRQSLLSKMGDDPEAYIEAQIRARLENVQAQKPAAPPASLASAAAAGSSKPVPTSGFAALFGE